MNWKRYHRVVSYLRSSLWVIPIAAGLLEQIFGVVVLALDAWWKWDGLGLGVEGARAVANAVITLNLSFIVFTFGSLLVAIQVASGQYTPRIIATILLNNNIIRYAVALFVFSLLFAIKALNQVEAHVPQTVVFVAGVLGLACLAVFLFLIDYCARLLRPVSLAQHVGNAGLAVIRSTYPDRFEETATGARPPFNAGTVTRTVLHEGTTATVVEVDVPRLVEEAESASGVIEFAPQVGDFVGADEPLFHLYGKAGTIPDDTLRACVIMGPERTMEQDPLFAFRILVDIALKALSAAINDPTTAVLAIDQLQRLLRSVGQRNLRTDEVAGASGELRLIFRTPDWDDFVNLAMCEIRCCGAGCMQIARRLRGMIVNLANGLPAPRHAALKREVENLDAVLRDRFGLPTDLALARVPDSQGLGGSTERPEVNWVR